LRIRIMGPRVKASDPMMLCWDKKALPDCLLSRDLSGVGVVRRWRSALPGSHLREVRTL
jgi:hypothetical protein